jgi:RNA polymerase sigma-70 factor (ECF subfamily)
VRGCASELQGCFSRHWLDVRHSANAVSSKDLFLLRHGVIETLEWSFVNGKLLSIVIATSKRYWWIAECRLDFGAIFYLDRSVPADDRATSLTGVGGSAQNGAVAFATTHWSVVLTAQDQTPEADAALEKLCRIYWWPLYGFVRRQGYGPEEAQDLTQGFFALVLERRDFDAVRREKGRLRSYLLVSLKNFVGKARRRELALKRGEGRSLVPLDELLARERAGLEPSDTLSADKVYERRWALTLLEQVLARLEEEYRAAGNELLFECLNELLAGEPAAPSQAAVAKKLGMTENAVKQAFYRLRQRYRELLREEIAHTVAVPGDVEDELGHFISVLQT